MHVLDPSITSPLARMHAACAEFVANTVRSTGGRPSNNSRPSATAVTRVTAGPPQNFHDAREYRKALELQRSVAPTDCADANFPTADVDGSFNTLLKERQVKQIIAEYGQCSLIKSQEKSDEQKLGSLIHVSGEREFRRYFYTDCNDGEATLNFVDYCTPSLKVSCTAQPDLHISSHDYCFKDVRKFFCEIGDIASIRPWVVTSPQLVHEMSASRGFMIRQPASINILLDKLNKSRLQQLVSALKKCAAQGEGPALVLRRRLVIQIVQQLSHVFTREASSLVKDYANIFGRFNLTGIPTMPRPITAAAPLLPPNRTASDTAECSAKGAGESGGQASAPIRISAIATTKVMPATEGTKRVDAQPQPALKSILKPPNPKYSLVPSRPDSSLDVGGPGFP
jgi:hypothetical protein